VRRTALAALAALALLTPARAQSPEQKKATVEYLRSLQTGQGGFAPAMGQDQPSLRATSSALRALKYFGGEPRDRDACARFVNACFNESMGGFTDRPGEGKPDVALTAVGAMVATELKLPAEKYVGPVVDYLGKHARTFEEIRIAAAGLEAIRRRPLQADHWLKQLERMRDKDGTYGTGTGKPRETGGAVAAELRLGGRLTDDRREAVLKALKAGQRPDGGFGKEGEEASDLESSYRVMRAFHMLKEAPDAKKLRTFVASCRNDDGGYGVAPGQKSSVSGTYYAGIVLHWLDGK
jgi:prenyltransferase beta subunit